METQVDKQLRKYFFIGNIFKFGCNNNVLMFTGNLKIELNPFNWIG